MANWGQENSKLQQALALQHWKANMNDCLKEIFTDEVSSNRIPEYPSSHELTQQIEFLRSAQKLMKIHLAALNLLRWRHWIKAVAQREQHQQLANSKYDLRLGILFISISTSISLTWVSSKINRSAHIRSSTPTLQCLAIALLSSERTEKGGGTPEIYKYLKS